MTVPVINILRDLLAGEIDIYMAEGLIDSIVMGKDCPEEVIENDTK